MSLLLCKKVAAAAFLAFLILWVVALAGGFALPLTGPAVLPVAQGFVVQGREDVLARRQFANNIGALGLARMPARGVLDVADLDKVQVHEKTGRLTTTTADFAADEAAIRAALAEHKATVSHERSGGIVPDRRLTLEVGVSPDLFDALREHLQRIGRLESASVERQDRTGELRQLAARRQSLKSHLEATRKLSTRDNPSIDDSLKVAREMRDVERELETLSAQAGDFLGKESFYTVSVTLVEDTAGRHGRTVTAARRAGNAFLWAAAWWGAAAVLAGSLAGAFVSVRVLVRPAPSAPPSSDKTSPAG
jgi:hypothetical protein